MKESYGEDLASHTDPESCAVARKGGREALTGACAGELWSREITMVRGADAVPAGGRLHAVSRQGKRYGNLARPENLCMHRNTSRENREIPCLPDPHGRMGRVGKSKDVSQRCTDTGSLTDV
jgi:RNA-directed DNA polymerase